MAHNRKSAPEPTIQDAVEEAVAQASVKTLGFAIHVSENDAYAATAQVTDLTELCDQAADHMALAHNLIVTHENHTDAAIGHLDAALNCLQRLSEEADRRAEIDSEVDVKPSRRASSR